MPDIVNVVKARAPVPVQLTPATISKLMQLAVPLRLDVDMYYYYLVRRIVVAMARQMKQQAALDVVASSRACLRGWLATPAPLLASASPPLLPPCRSEGVPHGEHSPSRSVSKRTVDRYDAFTASPAVSRVHMVAGGGAATVLPSVPEQDRDLYDAGRWWQPRCSLSGKSVRPPDCVPVHVLSQSWGLSCLT